MSRDESFALALRLVGGLPSEVCEIARARLVYLETVRRCCWCGEWSVDFPECARACDWCARICRSCAPRIARCDDCDGEFCLGSGDWDLPEAEKTCTCGEWRPCREAFCNARLCGPCASESTCSACGFAQCRKHLRADGSCPHPR